MPRPSLVSGTWPPRAFLKTPAPLFWGQEPNYLAYFRPTARPFYLFGSAHFPPGVTSMAHYHPCVAFHSCLQGPVHLVTPDGDQRLDAGVFYMLAPGVWHHWHNDGPHTAATMSFLIDTEHPGSWPVASGVAECCRELRRLVRGTHRFHVAGDPELQQAFWQLTDHLMAERPRKPVATTGLLCTLIGLILERLAPAAEPTPAQTDVAGQIRRLLLARVSDRLSIAEVAREVGLSPTRVKQVFRATYGCGIKAYFNQLKIGQAKRLLCDPALTVEQVSYKLRFSSPAYFSHVFAQYTGESPTAFRSRRLEVKA